MTILVFGAQGQVAQELQRATDVRALGRAELDLNDTSAIAPAIAAHAPDAVINAAAYTAVDAAEENEAEALRLNADAPGAMAKACAAQGIPFVHLSTDYVFPGGGEAPWRPDDATDPQSAYGRSKLAGEEQVRAAGGAYAILRTSWVVSAHGRNFVKTMRGLGEKLDALTVVGDEIGGPTPAKDIAKACLSIASALQTDPGKAGTYHYSGAPDVSWADFAREIFAQTGSHCTVTDIKAADWAAQVRAKGNPYATRPSNSRMDCTSSFDSFGISRPDWRVGLADILKTLAAEKA